MKLISFIFTIILTSTLNANQTTIPDDLTGLWSLKIENEKELQVLVIDSGKKTDSKLSNYYIVQHDLKALKESIAGFTLSKNNSGESILSLRLITNRGVTFKYFGLVESDAKGSGTKKELLKFTSLILDEKTKELNLSKEKKIILELGRLQGL